MGQIIEEKKRSLTRRAKAMSTTSSAAKLDYTEAEQKLVDEAKTRGEPIPRFVRHLPKPPRNYRELMNHPLKEDFLKARKVEYDRFDDLDVYEYSRLPDGKTLIRSMELYSYKPGPQGQVEKFKERTVAIGSIQKEGIDYGETYSPVVRTEVLRLMIALSVMFDLDIEQMDVATAFLYADLKEEVYMEPPPGFEKVDEHGVKLVWKLNKAIYGLHQSPREWFEHLQKYLVEECGYTYCKSTAGLFKKKDPLTHQIQIVMVYVDDLMIVASQPGLIEELKQKMRDKFEMKDLGKAKWLLKIEVVSEDDGIWIGQQSYIENIVQEFDDERMNNSKTRETPMSTTWKHSDDDIPLDKKDHKRYHSVVMKCAYAANTTRPDICFAVNTLASHQMKPTVGDEKALIHLLQYLRGTVDLGIKYTKSNFLPMLFGNLEFITGTIIPKEFYPEGFGDASYAEEEGRKSRSGYVFLICGGAITWLSKKQSTVATSSAEAEYYSLSEAVKEALNLKNILEEIGLVLDKPITINQDNKSTIAIAMNPIAHARTKHIEVRERFIDDHIKKENIMVVYCRTEEMIADVLTKALAGPQHWKLISMMGMRRRRDAVKDDIKSNLCQLYYGCTLRSRRLDNN